MIDERDRRRSDWIGGRPIKLSDGQDWLMPPVDFHWTGSGLNPTGPWWGMVPDPNPGDDVMRHLWRLTRAYTAPQGTATPDELYAAYKAQFDLASLLLRKNYHLSDEELMELLPFHPVRVSVGQENPLEMTESMATGPAVLEAFHSHTSRAIRNFSVEAIVQSHILYRINPSDVEHLRPED